MNPITTLGITLIRTYQLCVSPWLGANCRFHPNCSSYAIEALKTHGIIKGSILTLRRLSRCQPFAKDGIDPVPTHPQQSK